MAWRSSHAPCSSRGLGRRSRSWRRRLGDDVLEDRPVGGAHEEHRGGPLVAKLRQQRLASARHRLVDGEPVRERPVEVAGEGDGRAVADRELHRHDRGGVLLHEPLRDPAERVDRVGARRPAGVQDHHPQRVVVAQVGAEHRRGDRGAAAELVLEVEDALTQPLVEVAVADEVDDVGLLAAQPGAELGQLGARQPVQDDEAGLDPGGQSALQQPPLPIDIKDLEVAR